MSDASRQMGADRLQEDLQLLQRLRHQQDRQPRRQHQDHSTKKGRFEEGDQLFHSSGLLHPLDRRRRLAACRIGNSPARGTTFRERSSTLSLKRSRSKRKIGPPYGKSGVTQGKTFYRSSSEKMMGY